MEKKPAAPPINTTFVKYAVYGATALFCAGSIAYGIYKLSSVFSGGFGIEVFSFPLMMARKLFFNTLFSLVIGGGLIVWGTRNKKFWYLLPLGVIMLSYYWLKINLSVYQAYYEKFIK